ncbi:predicted protein [Histoplasma capsulatum var. duboisii H88]|uniref:Predicted protein n=2 Tax=Ajellomyces capsulatus TaxID=5037 RepID=F0U877_AJEC8|nr:predicted protein [Histoplasma capsulatum H143]EGC41690.1 predicted protein [Histoplasma capsulatum var. duboisii H88]
MGEQNLSRSNENDETQDTWRWGMRALIFIDIVYASPLHTKCIIVELHDQIQTKDNFKACIFAFHMAEGCVLQYQRSKKVKNHKKMIRPYVGDWSAFVQVGG